MTGNQYPSSNAEANARYREKNRERLAAAQRARNAALRLETFQVYGMECASCGYSDLRALCIDHIDNDGAAERRSLGGQHFSGKAFYASLKSRGWPSGYQTLCANCNLIKHVEFRSTAL